MTNNCKFHALLLILQNMKFVIRYGWKQISQSLNPHQYYIELTWHEVMNLTSSALLPLSSAPKICKQWPFCVIWFVIYFLNKTHVTSKMVFSKGLQELVQYGQVMAIFLLACKEMVTRIKRLLIWWFLFTSRFVGCFCQW